MKNWINLLFLTTLFALVLSCDGVNNNLVQQYKESLALFNKEKTNHPAYEFTLSFSSVMTGFSNQTTFLVENEKVVKRVYQESKMNWDTQEQELLDSWEEINDAVGSHKNAVQATTLEQIYEQVPSLIKVDTNLNYVYFEARHDGIISSAGHFPKNCADDCFKGYQIRDFRWVNDLQAALASSLANNTSTVKILDAELDKKLQSSLALFNAEKAKHKGYQFALSFESGEGGFGYTTTFIVEQGILISRAYEGFRYNRKSQEEVKETPWEETGLQIGSNKQGHKPITLESIYAALPALIQVDSSQNHIYFDTKHQGIVSIAGHFPEDCADDCFEGYEISTFKWID